MGAGLLTPATGGRFTVIRRGDGAMVIVPTGPRPPKSVWPRSTSSSPQDHHPSFIGLAPHGTQSGEMG